MRGQNVIVPFLLHSQRTAAGAECSPTDLVEWRGRGESETTRKGQSKRLEVSHLYSITIWVDGSLL